MNHGPQLPISQEVGQDKHYPNETFEESRIRIAHALADDPQHEDALLEILLDMRFIPAGRVQRAAGHFDTVTAFNCFVSGTLPDSMSGIMEKLAEAAQTMKLGGGIGYSFGTIRPRGALINSVSSLASGAVSFMEPFNATCGTIASAGNRRGAQMGVMPIWHPDALEFIRAKSENGRLTNFNVSLGITDDFMMAVVNDEVWEFTWDGEVYSSAPARELWDEIMETTWDWAEPGILFLDRINQDNNLFYCEEIAATNPCGEQPLPPYGACLLGSFNWVRYIKTHCGTYPLDRWEFDIEQFVEDIHVVVRAMDNVVDRTIYPLAEQEQEAKNKRRMGLGAMGVANALEAMGYRYGTPEAAESMGRILQVFTNECYLASAFLADEKGAFPLYDEDFYLYSEFVQKRLDPYTREAIEAFGIRNSHLTSIAPTGTISLAADNVSSGIEPPFALWYDRTILMPDGSQKVERVTDYALNRWGIEGRTANELTPMEHVRMLTEAQKWVDSAVSKTCNIGDEVTFEAFKGVYMEAWKSGAKGCTTFRAAGKRFGVLNAIATEDTPEEPEPKPSLWQRLKEFFRSFQRPAFEAPAPSDAYAPAEPVSEGAACTFDPATGKKTCE